MIEILMFTIALFIGDLIGIFVTLHYLKDIIDYQLDKESDKHFDWLIQFLATKEDISGEQFREITMAFAKEFMCDDDAKNNSEQ